MDDLSPEKLRLLSTEGHILALGGPGSGKTFIALLKAEREIKSGMLLPGQHILFFSFARATITRIAQQANRLVSGTERKLLEIDTYHGFAWKLIRSHGYLLNANKIIKLLPPPDAAVRLAEIEVKARPAEQRRLFKEEGLLHFDLFASISAELLSKSQRLASIISDAYPLIILDEFQDTNADEWKMIRMLGKKSHLIALADVDQRIYEFRGADPNRIGEFISEYSPTKFDFGMENNRSNGTDIVIFGNDLLTGTNKLKTYNNVSLTPYGFYRGKNAHFSFKTSILRGLKRQYKQGDDRWSIAVLVPTKKLMLSVSDYLTSELDGLPAVSHEVAMDTEGPALAAVLIAGLLEGVGTKLAASRRMISDLCAHIRGRRGNEVPTQSELKLAGALDDYLKFGKIKGPKRFEIVRECVRIVDERRAIPLTGDPGQDWLATRKIFVSSSIEEIRNVAEDAKYLRLLHKGALLRTKLGELWRTFGFYVGAAVAVRDTLLQEHFSASSREWRGIHVMTIHKSKGKEFDEVFIYEGTHQGRLVRPNASQKDISQARLVLRVAVTRAMKHTTILTPQNDPCIFL